MNFNLDAELSHRRLQQNLVPWFMKYKWTRYQLQRLKAAYWPAFKGSKESKSSARIVLELMALCFVWRCAPFHYFRYGLYQRSLTWKEVLGYLPETVFYHRILPQTNFNVIVLDDKRITRQILESATAGDPKLVAWGDRTGVTMCRSKLREGDHVVVKPSWFSSGGAGVEQLTYMNGHFTHEDGRPFDEATYRSVWGDWMIETFVSAKLLDREESNEIGTSFRVITTIESDGDVKVRKVVMKIAPEGVLTDNAHTGGLYVGVATSSGNVYPVAYDEGFTRWVRSPVTGRLFATSRVPAINQIKELAVDAAKLFPSVGLVGWDIILAPDGPKIIEGNSSPGLTNLQRTHGGMAEELKEWHRGRTASP